LVPPPFERAIEKPSNVVVLHTIIAVPSVHVDRHVPGPCRPYVVAAEGGDPQRPPNARQVLPHLRCRRASTPVVESPGAHAEGVKPAARREDPDESHRAGA